jgi:hypothetical protein
MVAPAAVQVTVLVQRVQELQDKEMLVEISHLLTLLLAAAAVLVLLVVMELRVLVEQVG